MSRSLSLALNLKLQLLNLSLCFTVAAPCLCGRFVFSTELYDFSVTQSLGSRGPGGPAAHWRLAVCFTLTKNEAPHDERLFGN